MITHVSAYNGGLRMYAGDYRNLKGWSKTAKGVAYRLGNPSKEIISAGIASVLGTKYAY